MENACRKACVRFDEKNARVHLEEDGFGWSTIPPSSLWYTRDDYKLFQERDDLIVSLVNGYRFYETKDHTYRGLEGDEYDRYRKSISRRAVTSEQDRQRIIGIHDPQKISEIYRSFCSHSAQQASVRGIHDAFIAREDVHCISTTYDPTLSDDSIAELHSPQKMRVRSVTKSMNPSLISSSISAGESSRRPPFAPRTSGAAEIASNTEEYQQKLSPTHPVNFESPHIVGEVTSNECMADDRTSAISPISSHRNGYPVYANISPDLLKQASSKMDFVISPRQQSKSKPLKSISRKLSPKKTTESVSPFKGNAKISPHRRITTIPKSLGLNINLLQ